MSIQLRQLKTIAIAGYCAGFLNTLFLHVPIIGAFAAIAFFTSTSVLAGKRLFEHYHFRLGLLSIISFTSLSSAALYYIVPVSTFVFLIPLTAILLFAFTTNQYESYRVPVPTLSFLDWLIALIGFGGIFIWWQSIATFTFTNSVRSIWTDIHPIILASLALTVLSSIYLLQKQKVTGHLLLGAVFTSAASLATKIFPLSFGFDPFIHKATLSHIAEHGFINPKPLYYIGDYVLELIAFLNFGIPIQTVNTILVPIIGSIILFSSVSIAFNNSRSIGALALLFFPISSIITTTPQSLSYIITACLVFLSLTYYREKSIPLSLLWILAVTALVIHPLSGIPAMLYVAIMTIMTYASSSALRAPLLVSFSFLASLALPLVFYVQARLTGLAIHINPGHLFNFSGNPLSLQFQNNFSPWLDIFYSYSNNLWLILALLSLLGCIALIREKQHVFMTSILLMTGILLMNYVILATTVEFNFLVEYEQLNYTNRLLVITHLFLLPLVGYGLLIRKKLSASIILFCILGFLALTYTAYPRDDGFTRSRGFNVSQSDIDAAWAIEEYADGSTYSVLANQAMSAAALQEFGFKQYFPGDIFYYPIPTGGELYSYYLQMADEAPTKEVVEKVRELTGAETIFFALHDYWWQADRIKEIAKQESDDWFAIGEGAITIFVFD